MTAPPQVTERKVGAARASTALLLGLVVLILGFNWPILATGLRSISPVWLSALRLGGGLVIVLLITALTGDLHRPRRDDQPIIWSVGVGKLALTYLLVFTALRILPPGRSSVLAWTSPLWTAPLAVAFLGERMTRARWVGLGMGAAGLFFLFEPWVLDWSDGEIVWGHVLLIAAAFVSAATMVHIRHHGGSRGTAMQLMPWQMLAGAVPVTAIAFLVEGWPRIEWTPQLIAIVAYQGSLGAAFTVWAQQIILRRISATSTNLILMAVPVVGLLSSAVLVDDPLTVGAVVGLILILIGVGANIRGPEVDPIS
ncbi:MAG TPA: DMT family transporter [Acidimicrobiia bacterium]|nr:DMT family transporter [Acidimicrobiia bacterium]